MDEEGLGWDRVTLKRGTGLAQGCMEKEGGELMVNLLVFRLILQTKYKQAKIWLREKKKEYS